MKAQREGINALAKPSGTGCVECLATGSWWLHLRRCAECGHIGCVILRQISMHRNITPLRVPDYHEFRAGGVLVLRLPFRRIFCRPESPRSARASVRSASTGAGWACALRLANAAPRIGAPRS